MRSGGLRLREFRFEILGMWCAVSGFGEGAVTRIVSGLATIRTNHQSHSRRSRQQTKQRKAQKQTQYFHGDLATARATVIHFKKFCLSMNWNDPCGARLSLPSLQALLE